MSGKLRPRLKPVRVKLTRASQTRSELRLREEPSDFRHDRVATEPDCSEAVLLDSLEEGVHKNGERLRNLSMCLDGTLLQGRKSTRIFHPGNESKSTGKGARIDGFRKLHANSTQTRPLSIPSRSTEDFSDTIAGLRASGLSFALQREERRADQLCAAFQAIGPVVSEIAERLRRKEEKKKLEAELLIARETISELSKDVEQLTSEVKLLSTKNVSLLTELESCGSLKTFFETSVEALSLSAQHHFSTLSSSLDSLESRLQCLQARFTDSLRDTLSHIVELNDICRKRAEDEALLHSEITHLHTVLQQHEDYTSEKLARMEREQTRLSEENSTLRQEVRRLIEENDLLGRKAEESIGWEAATAANVLLSQEIDRKTEELSTNQAQMRLQSLELLELRKEVTVLTATTHSQQERELALSTELLRIRLEMKEMQTAYATYEDELRSDAIRDTIRMVNAEKRHLLDQKRKTQSVDIDSSPHFSSHKKTVIFAEPLLSEEDSEVHEQSSEEGWNYRELTIDAIEGCEVISNSEGKCMKVSQMEAGNGQLTPEMIPIHTQSITSPLTFTTFSPLFIPPSTSPTIDFSLSPESEGLPGITWRDEALIDFFDMTPGPESVITTYIHGEFSWKLIHSQKNGFFWRPIHTTTSDTRLSRTAILLQNITRTVQMLLPECGNVLEGVEILLGRIRGEGETWKRVEQPLFEAGETEQQHTPFPRGHLAHDPADVERSDPLHGAVISLLCELPPLSKEAETAISRVLAELQAPPAAVKQVAEARSSKSSPPGLSRVAAW